MANAGLFHTALLLRYSVPGLFPASAHHCCFGHHRFLRFQCEGEGARLTTFAPVFRWSFQNNAGRYGTGELKGCREHRFTGNHLPSVPRGTLYIVAKVVRFGKKQKGSSSQRATAGWVTESVYRNMERRARMEDKERNDLPAGVNEDDEVVAEQEETLKYLDSARKIMVVSAVISAMAVACIVIGILAR